MGRLACLPGAQGTGTRATADAALAEGGQSSHLLEDLTMSQRTLAPGLFLIGLGAFLLLVQTTSLGSEAVVAVIGAAFVVAYFAKRIYGFLVAGGIMLGLGLGILWQVETGSDGAVLIGLGLGFVSIWVIGNLMRDEVRHWWPLIPGGIIATVGVLVEAEQTGFLRSYGDLWPLILVVIGAILLLAQMAGRPAEASDPATPPATTTAAPPAPTAPTPSENPVAR